MQMMQQNPDTRDPLHFLDYWRIVASRKEVVITAFLLVMVAGIVTTFTMRKTFSASVLIQVKKDVPDVDLGFNRELLHPYDPTFLRTQFEIIQSRPVVEETVRLLNLDEKLGKAYGYNMLSKEKVFERTVKLLSRRMRVQQFRDTNLIEIQTSLSEFGGVDERAPEEAARTANMLAEVFRNQSTRRSRDQKTIALQAVKEALEKQKLAVTAADKRVEDIRLKFKIDVLSRQHGTESTLGKLTLQELESRRIMASQSLIGKKSKYEKLRSLSPEERLHAAIHIQRDEMLSSLVASKHRREVDLHEKLKDFGEKHPEVQGLRAQIDDLQKKSDTALTGLMTGLRIEYETAEDEYKEILSQLDLIKSSQRQSEAAEYREFDKADDDLQQAMKMRDRLQERYQEEWTELGIPKTTVEVMEAAKAPDVDDFVSPNHLVNILLSLLVGLITGIGLAFFVEYMDTSVKTIEDIEQSMGLPVLGVIPQKVRPFTEEPARSRYSEAYRVLRTNIQFSKKYSGGKVLCVTSGSVGEGKSLTVFNLAYTSAQLGDRVILVDADLHRPTQHKMLKLKNDIGLANVLAGDVLLDDAIMTAVAPNMDFLPSGKMAAGTHGLLDTTRVVELIRVLKERYDRIFFDAPPIIGVSDAAMLTREMEGVLMIIQHRKYPKAISGRAKFMIDNVGGNLIGVVLNKLNIARDYSYYGYSYYSNRYHYGKEGQNT